MVKISVNSSGMTIDSFPTEYKETNGFLIPMKTSTTAQGMQFVMNFTKVEVDIPVDDNIFRIN